MTKPVFLHILFSRNYRIFSKGMEQEKYFSVGRQREAVSSWERLSSEEKEVRLRADPGNRHKYPDPVSTRYVHGVLRQSEGHCPLSRVEPRINSSLR